MKLSSVGKGTYVGAKFSPASVEVIKQLQKSLGLFDPVKESKLHTTISFSRKYFEGFALNTNQTEIGRFKRLEVFPTQTGKRALVAIFDSPYLEERHKYSRILGASYDYDEYHPHVTLSYDIGALKLPEIDLPTDIISISHEYVEDLDLEWKA